MFMALFYPDINLVQIVSVILSGYSDVFCFLCEKSIPHFRTG